MEFMNSLKTHVFYYGKKLDQYQVRVAFWILYVIGVVWQCYVQSKGYFSMGAACVLELYLDLTLISTEFGIGHSKSSST